MNTKWMLAVVSVAVLAVALTMGGLAYAQGSQPPVGNANEVMAQMRAQMGGQMRGGGMGGGLMAQMHAQMQLQDGTGPMHEAMLNALAEGLGLSRTELDSRLAAGETPYTIALAEGLTAEEFTALMQTARAEAVAQAVEDGTLTQEQADWMLSHNMGGMMNGQGGMMNGQGQGRGMMNGTDGTCPLHAPAATPVP